VAFLGHFSSWHSSARQAGTWPPRSGRSSRAVGELSIHQLGVAVTSRPSAAVAAVEGRACLIASACMLQTALKEALRHSSPSPRPLYDCRSCLLASARSSAGGSMMDVVVWRRPVCKKPPIADWFHIAVRLQHAKQAASGLVDRHAGSDAGKGGDRPRSRAPALADLERQGPPPHSGHSPPHAITMRASDPALPRLPHDGATTPEGMGSAYRHSPAQAPVPPRADQQALRRRRWSALPLTYSHARHRHVEAPTRTGSVPAPANELEGAGGLPHYELSVRPAVMQREEARDGAIGWR
jgi:hypothetical protein